MDKLLYATVCGVGAGLATWRMFFPYIGDDIKIIQASRRVADKVVKAMLEDRRIIDAFEEVVAKHPKKTFIIFEDKLYSYELVDFMANKVANVFGKLGYTHHDTIAMMIFNEPAFVWTLLGKRLISFIFSCYGRCHNTMYKFILPIL